MLKQEILNRGRSSKLKFLIQKRGWKFFKVEPIAMNRMAKETAGIVL